MNVGITLVFPLLPACKLAILAACTAACGPGTPWLISEEETLDLKSEIKIVPRIAKPRLAP
jgi:hypothetical protein